jgi:hypothetical protein
MLKVMKIATQEHEQHGIRALPRHSEWSVLVERPAEQVFAYVDDHQLLSSHMSQSSWKMGGGKMEVEMDTGAGKRVGSKIRLAGRVLGILLWVDEIVIVRDPPRQKIWETIGTPRLLVIGHYRMGLTVMPQGTGSLLQVFIDYELPATMPTRLLGYLLGKYYANWCTRQLALDTRTHFSA